MTITSGGSERFGDTPVSFTMSRFEGGTGPFSGDKRSKWFFAVSRFIGRDVLIEAELTPANLRCMARWCERAAEMVESDGGRLRSGKPEV